MTRKYTFIERKQYTREQRIGAVVDVMLERGYVLNIAQRWGVASGTLYKWLRAAQILTVCQYRRGTRARDSARTPQPTYSSTKLAA